MSFHKRERFVWLVFVLGVFFTEFPLDKDPLPQVKEKGYFQDLGRF